MRRSRFSEEQIIGILKEHEIGISTADVCRKHSISEPTLYTYKAKFGGMNVSSARKLKALEDENAKLKKLLAEQMLDNAMLKDVNAKSGDAHCEAASCGTPLQCARGEPATGVFCASIDRSSVRYRNTRPDEDQLHLAIKKVAAERRRFGYRRIHVMLE